MKHINYNMDPLVTIDDQEEPSSELMKLLGQLKQKKSTLGRAARKVAVEEQPKQAPASNNDGSFDEDFWNEYEKTEVNGKTLLEKVDAAKCSSDREGLKIITNTEEKIYLTEFRDKINTALAIYDLKL